LVLAAQVGPLQLLLHHKEITPFLDHLFLHLQQIQQLLLVVVMVVVESIKEHRVVLAGVVV
jgi:hypothetical protein